MPKLEDIDLINYVINNEATLKDAASYFDVSLSTVKKKMSKIKKELNKQSQIYMDLKELVDNNEKQGRIDGGKNHSGLKYDKFNIEDIAKMAMSIIALNYSIDEAAIQYEIAPSTLYERLQTLECEEYQELYNDLTYIFEIHKRKEKISGDKKQIVEQLRMKYQSKLDQINSIKK